MRSKIIVLFSVLTIASTLLAACGPTTTPAPQIIERTVVVEKPVEKPVVQTVVVQQTVQVPVEAKAQPIVMWASYDLTDEKNPPSVTLKQAIATFEATTGIKVKYEQVAWDKLSTKLALQAQSGGDMPDVVETSSQHVLTLINAGALADLTDSLKDSAWMKELNPSEAQACVIGGKRYCVAADIRGGAWYYNTADFPNGWPVKAEDWLKEGARMAGSKYVATFFAGKHYGAAELSWGPWIYSNGGHLFDKDGKPVWATPETVEVVNWARDLLAKKYVPETCFTGDFTAGETPWVDGKAAAVRGGSWSFLFIPGLKDKIEKGETKLGPAPAFKTGKSYVFLVGEGWGVAHGAKNPKGATAWLNFFMNPQILAQWASQHYGIPTIPEAFKASAFDNDFYRETAKNLADNGIFIESSPYYQESLDALAVAMQELMLDPKLDPLEHLQKAQDEILNRYFK